LEKIMRRTKAIIRVVIIIGLVFGQLSIALAQNETVAGLSPEARDYLNRALDLIQKGSIKRETNWEEFRRLTFEKADKAKTPADTYPAIRDALQRLGDHHSSLYTPDDLKMLETGRTGARKDLGIRIKDLVIITVFPDSSASRAGLEIRDKIIAIDNTPLNADSDYSRILNELKKKSASGVALRLQRGKGEPRDVQLEFAEFGLNPPVQGRMVGDGIGLIKLPQFGASLTDQKKAREVADQFAERVQNVIRELDQNKVRGWILDLRVNGGGNMWPMLAGVGPILGEGEVGSFISASGAVKWRYQDGKSMIYMNVSSQVVTPYRVKVENPPVAVLTDEFTASSGEAIVIAFKGRAKTHFFGMPTRGVPTANEPFKLSDGAVLNLTTALEADRTGKQYDSKILPDTEIKTDWLWFGTDDDPVIKAAVKWLESQT
jgi:C-terminal processing protease CtpA/Prc